MPLHKQCAQCGIPFETLSPHQRFCTPGCRWTFHFKNLPPRPARTKTCQACDRPFHVSGNRRYCAGCQQKRKPKRLKDQRRECLACGTTFTPRTGTNLYCSPTCSGKEKAPSATRSCLTCGAEFKPRTNQRYCDSCGPRSTGGRTQASRYRRHKGTECRQCGFVPAIPAQLDVHHIDGDCKNNAPENLETLCANCHRLETWGGDR